MTRAGPKEEPGAAEREVNIAKLALLERRASVHSLATVANTGLLGIMLWRTAPRSWLLVWALLQAAGAAFLFLRSRRRRLREPRGSQRGIQRAAWLCTAAGITLGSVVLLLGGASDLARLLVLVTLAAMASAASTTLAPIPRAAQGYIAGALLLPAARWMLQGELEYFVLALLAVSMALFLVFNARITHGSFLESLGRAREIARLSAQFRDERAEWLDLSQATEAFVLLDAEGKVLLWNNRFQELLGEGRSPDAEMPIGTDLEHEAPVEPNRVERGRDYVEILAGTSAAPQTVGGQSVGTSTWLSLRREQLEKPAELLEGYANDIFYQVSAKRLPSGRQVVNAVNVTALKRTERALREQDHALAQAQRQESVGVIAGGVAHDFNNLLTAIRGASELLMFDAHGDVARGLLRDIGASVDRGARLTRQLLAYGRLQSLSPRVLDLNRELDKSLAMFRRLLPASVRIETELAKDLRPVFADPEQLAQVTMNLVLNARDAMPHGGVLRLGTTNVGDLHVELYVSDDGIGMAPETAERMFEPFFSTKDQQRGSGLGLSAVQGIVRQSGGTVQVETRLGAGTTLRIRLPHSERQAQTVVPPDSATRPPPGNRERLLVVDDEALVRDMTARLLRRQGYDVTEAETPRAALDQLDSRPGWFALLLTDVVMPEMSGVELAAAARCLNPDMPVLFMSGYEPGLFDQTDAHDVLQKPFKPAELLRAVSTALARASARTKKSSSAS